MLWTINLIKSKLSLQSEVKQTNGFQSKLGAIQPPFLNGAQTQLNLHWMICCNIQMSLREDGRFNKR